MRAAARAGEFLRRKRSVVALFPGYTQHFNKNLGHSFSSTTATEIGPLPRVSYCDGQEVGCQRIPSLRVCLCEQFFGRSYSGAAQGLMEGTSEGDSGFLRGESTDNLKTMDSNSRVGVNSSHEFKVVNRVAGEDVRIDTVSQTPGISSTSTREEVELAVEAKGMKELVEGTVADDGNLAKRLKVEAAAVLPHVVRAWDHWNKLGAPKLMVAPMVDQSELPFRMLCRKYGATAAYSPMLHSRLFAQDAKYRTKEFSTCPVSEDICAPSSVHMKVLCRACFYVSGEHFAICEFHAC